MADRLPAKRDAIPKITPAALTTNPMPAMTQETGMAGRQSIEHNDVPPPTNAVAVATMPSASPAMPRPLPFGFWVRVTLESNLDGDLNELSG
jgi:hypothetical protein